MQPLDVPPPILRELPEELVGERVLVRAVQPGDGAALWEAIEEAREHLRPWLPWVDEQRSPSDSEAYARRAHARWLTRDDMVHRIWDRQTGQCLGAVGLHPANWNVPSFEIGYWLRPSAVGRGYMTEAVRLVCGLAFEVLGAARVFIRCDPHNTRSAAVPQRLGFRHEGTLRCDTRSPSGELRDTMYWGMTAEEWGGRN